MQPTQSPTSRVYCGTHPEQEIDQFGACVLCDGRAKPNPDPDDGLAGPVERPTLSVWTIYSHPKDYPDDVVLREWVLGSDGKAMAGRFALFTTVSGAREVVKHLASVCLGRQPQDDPVIVESWI